MITQQQINSLKIASPCTASWNAMTGDDRARLCSLCDKHVYNIATLTSPEIDELIQRTQGDFCGRLYRRRDGTVLTADCPVGAKAFSEGRWHRTLTYVVLGIGFLTTGAFVWGRKYEMPDWPPTGPGVTFADWKDWALGALGLVRPIPLPHYGAFAPIDRQDIPTIPAPFADEECEPIEIEPAPEPKLDSNPGCIEPPALSRFPDPYDPERMPAAPEDQLWQRLWLAITSPNPNP